MSFTIFFVCLIFVILPLGIFLRFVDLGLPIRLSIKMLFKFPKEILIIHYLMYKRTKNKDKRLAIAFLFAPITNLSSVIISYAEMYMDAYAKFLAVTELLEEINERERKKLTKILKHQGITIKRRKVKKVDVIDDKSNVDNYVQHLGLSKVLGVH